MEISLSLVPAPACVNACKQICRDLARHKSGSKIHRILLLECIPRGCKYTTVSLPPRNLAEDLQWHSSQAYPSVSHAGSDDLSGLIEDGNSQQQSLVQLEFVVFHLKGMLGDVLAGAFRGSGL